MDRPILQKWEDIASYAPSVAIDESSMPVWHSVPEIFGHMSASC